MLSVSHGQSTSFTLLIRMFLNWDMSLVVIFNHWCLFATNSETAKVRKTFMSRVDPDIKARRSELKKFPIAQIEDAIRRSSNLVTFYVMNSFIQNKKVTIRIHSWFSFLWLNSLNNDLIFCLLCLVHSLFITDNASEKFELGLQFKNYISYFFSLISLNDDPKLWLTCFIDFLFIVDQSTDELELEL